MPPSTTGAEATGLRLAVVGKGGSGKSVVSGTLARVLARRGRRVLALDSDTLPGLAYSLGVEAPEQPRLMAAAERDAQGRWRFAEGIGPVRAIQRFAIPGPDGLLLLQIGKTTKAGQAPVMAATQAFHKTIHGLTGARTFDSWDVIGDLSAGPRQLAFDWAPYARTILLVVEPTRQSIMTARRVRRIVADARPAVSFALVVNKAERGADARDVAEALELPAAAVVPADDDVRASERAGVALIDHAPHAVALAALEGLADHLQESTVEP